MSVPHPPPLGVRVRGGGGGEGEGRVLAWVPVIAEIGLALGGCGSGESGAVVKPQGAVTRERESWLISPIRARHTPSPLTPTASARRVGRGERVEMGSPGFHSFLQSIDL